MVDDGVTYDRGRVLAAIEAASGVLLSANDCLPDSLIAQAQSLGISARELETWIADPVPMKAWTTESLANFALYCRFISPYWATYRTRANGEAEMSARVLVLSSPQASGLVVTFEPFAGDLKSIPIADLVGCEE